MRNKMIMVNAWKIARRAAKKFGGKVVEYFAESLRMAWAMYKNSLAKKGGDILGLAPWFINKEFGHKSMLAQLNRFSPLFIKKQTEKAYLLEYVLFDIDNKTVLDRPTFWAPKSVCI